MKLHTYVNEILDIAKANNVSWDIGADMFLANIRNFGKADIPFWYKGADQVNYQSLKGSERELELSKPAFAEAYRKHNKEIIALRKNKEFDKVKEIMEA